MTDFTADRCADKVTHLSTGMTAKASDRGVGTEQWKTGAVVQNDLPFGNPVAFVVALDSIASQAARDARLVAADTASPGRTRPPDHGRCGSASTPRHGGHRPGRPLFRGMVK